MEEAQLGQRWPLEPKGGRWGEGRGGRLSWTPGQRFRGKRPDGGWLEAGGRMKAQAANVVQIMQTRRSQYTGQ